MATHSSVRDYCVLLTKSKLLPAEEVESVYKRWKEETRGQDDQVDPFCKYLVTRRSLTEWQAAMVRRGRADGFFLGGYKILDRIGKGQMGGVYKAVHGLGQMVALKILPASKAKEQHILSRFQREARLLTQLDHPNVVRAFQVGEGSGINFIAMEYLEGETLDETLSRRKRLPWPEAVRIVHQALNGLEHLHQRRMIHRDIKPANMMLVPAPAKNEPTWNATVKILDIGLGREMFDESTPEGQIETQLTVEGSVLGTPDYLAPEQAKDARNADIRADIYSFGCVLFHCVCGRPPFPETNIMSQMLKHATERPPLLSSIVSDTPAGLQSVLDIMMAKSPDERYSSPAASAEALKPFLGKSGMPAVATPMIPAFKTWLESESNLELPQLPQIPPPPSKPVPAAQMPSAKPAMPPLPSQAATSPPPIEPAGARVVGSRAVPVAPARPVPIVPAKPQAPAPARPAPREEVDVELVADYAPSPQSPALAPEVQVVKVRDNRPLWEFDRRDWIMLAAGAAGVLAAVGVGYGLARLVRKKPEEPPAEG